MLAESMEQHNIINRQGDPQADAWLPGDVLQNLLNVMGDLQDALRDIATLTIYYYLTPVILALLVVIYLTYTSPPRNHGRLINGFGIQINFPVQSVRVRAQRWIRGQNNININVVWRWPWEWRE